MLMKKTLSLFVLLAAMSAGLYAYDFKSGDAYYNITSNEVPYTVAVTSGNYTGMVSVVIPAVVSHNDISYTVTRIDHNAFYGCTTLASIHIPYTITSIGANALYNTAWAKGHVLDGPVVLGHVLAYYQGTMPEAYTAIIPENVTVINENAFNGYKNLIAVGFNEHITHIGDYAFKGCSNMGFITLPWDLVSIGDGAFLSCTGKVGPLIITNAVTTIGKYAFGYCTGITKLAIGKSVKRIAPSAFSGCSNVTAIEWNAIHYDDSKDSFAEDAPLGYVSNQITSFLFSKEVEYIPKSLCRGMSKVTTITIPKSVTAIGSFAFYGAGLTEIHSDNPIPPTIQQNTFMGIDRNIPVYVPTKEAVTAYKEADYWKEFFNIIGPNETALDNATAPTEAKKIVRDGQVVIVGEKANYDLRGNIIETQDNR